MIFQVWEGAKEHQPAQCVWSGMEAFFKGFYHCCSASPSVLNLPYDRLVQGRQVQVRAYQHVGSSSVCPILPL